MSTIHSQLRQWLKEWATAQQLVNHLLPQQVEQSICTHENQFFADWQAEAAASQKKRKENYEIYRPQS